MILTRIEDQRWVRDIEFSPDGNAFYVISEAGLVRRDAISGEILQEYSIENGSRLLLTADGQRLIVGGFEHPTVIFDTDSGMLLNRFDLSSQIALNPDETILATYNYLDGVITFWDFDSGEPIGRLTAFAPETNAMIIFSEDGNQLISAGNHQLIRWDVPAAMNDTETWITNNRYIADFTCEQRTFYDIEPLCETDS